MKKFTLPYLTLPYLTLPYLTLPYLTLPYLTLPCSCVLALLIAAFSCMPEDTPPVPANPAPPRSDASVTQLGRQLKNPYSLTNMQRALDSMRNRFEHSSDPSIGAFTVPAKRIEIEATNLYVRFLPRDSAEMNRLESDPALELFDYPLDHEIVRQGYYYHDPTLPANSYTWQYTVVKPDYTFPNIRYEVLERLFIPENSPLYNREAQSARAGSEATATQLLPKLETLSLLLTDNLPDKEKERLDQGWCFLFWCEPDFWDASGRVTVENYSAPPPPSSPSPSSNNNASGANNNDNYNSAPPNAYITGSTAVSTPHDPVKQVRVRMRRWFNIKRVDTDSSGNFSYPNVFRRPANYSLVFANDRVRVKASWVTGIFSSARYDGPKRRGEWNITFYYNSVGWLWSNIMTGVYDFYKQSKDVLGLANPLPKPVHIVANQHENIDSYAHMGSKWGSLITESLFPDYTSVSRILSEAFLNDIRIYKQGKNSQDIYGTIIHELGHTLHWKTIGTFSYVVLGASGVFFGKRDERTLIETWAGSVELTFVRGKKYPEYKPYTQTKELKEWKKTAYIRVFVEDLSDTHNQQAVDSLWPLDRVSGFTLRNMYNALKGAYSMRSWRNNLYRGSPGNPTRQYLEEYFQQYDASY